MGESRASVFLLLSVEAGFSLSLSGDRWLERPDPVFADEGMGKRLYAGYAELSAMDGDLELGPR